MFFITSILYNVHFTIKLENRIGDVMPQRARLECDRSWVRASFGSNQRLLNWYLLLLR
jgi:hypothetical protein